MTFPERVFKQAERSFRPEDQVGIAVTRVRTRDHIGLFYRGLRATAESPPPVRQFHLAWHFDLKNEPVDELFSLWVDPAVGRRAKHLAAYCRLVWAQNEDGRLAYAFTTPVGALTTEGSFTDSGRLGLTCASFVLAIFHHAGLPLIRYDEWPEREDDVLWQGEIAQMLQAKGASKTHLETVRSQIGCVRYRPVEVGAAGLAAERPASFASVGELAQVLNNLLSS